MKQRQFFMLLVAMAVLYGCKRNRSEDRSAELKGTLAYKNPYDGTDTTEKKLPNRTIYIANHPSDTTKALDSTKTNTTGEFNFKKLFYYREYDLFFRDTISGRLYTAFTTVRASLQDVKLVALPDTKKQQGISIKVTSGLPFEVNNRVCLFKKLADAAAISDQCINSSFVVFFNAGGKGVKYNVPPGKYYIQGIQRSGNFLYYKIDSVEIPSAGVVEKLLALERTNGMELIALDNLPSSDLEHKIYIYTDRAAFLAFNSQYIKVLHTDGFGIANDYRIPPGRYYLKAVSKSLEILMHGEDSCDVNSTEVAKKTITMYQN